MKSSILLASYNLDADKVLLFILQAILMDVLAPDRVCEAFLAAPPLISEQIIDLTMKYPVWMRDLYALEEFPRGSGAIMEQLIFRGSKPKIERDFSRWKKVNNMSGCNPGPCPDPSYNFTTFGGHGMERKLMELMQRDFRSPTYDVSCIQTTANFKEVFAKIVENLYSQIDFFKEINIGQTVLTMLAKKYVVDSEGPKPNIQNPYVYRNIGTARLATLNLELCEFFYEQMRRMPEAIPYDVIDGAPIFSIIASAQMFRRVYRDHPELRKDVRFSGLANDLLTKYNFMSTMGGMFIAAPILYPRRFNIVAGEPLEILPFLNDVPAEYGCYTYLNPDYEAATHEEVIFHGRYPFKIFYMPTETTLGENTSFGPEYSFMNSWIWVNPLTIDDPARRTGFFFTSAKIGISQQFSDAIFGVLCERPSVRLTAIFAPTPVCPPEDPDCDNVVPDVDCPCAVLAADPQVSPFDPANYFFTFATPLDVVATDTIVLQLDSGGTVTGTVVQVSTDGMTVEMSFTADIAGVVTAKSVVGVSCEDWAKCSANVIGAVDCRSNQTGVVELTLDTAIKATAGDEVLVYFGDCTTAMVSITAVNGLVYSIEYAAGFGPTDDPTGVGTTTILSADMLCDRMGVSKVCVPPATDATCPPCDLTLTACVSTGS